HASLDATGWHTIRGPADSDRPRPASLSDVTESENFRVTEDPEQLWELRADRRNIYLNSFRDCEYTGFAYNHSEYRWPSLRTSAGIGRITATVPDAGPWVVGLVVYDGPGRENYRVRVEGKPIGLISAGADNRRQRLFFHPEPLALAEGDRIEVKRAPGGGAFIVEDIVLLKERPGERAPQTEIRDLSVQWDPQRGRMRATWWTTQPAVCALACAGKTYAGSEPLQNHRVHLGELPRGGAYTCELTARFTNPECVLGAQRRFVAGPSTPPDRTATRRIELSILGDAVPAGWPITNGVPFAKGELKDVARTRLLAGDGNQVPGQTKALTYWPDGSIKSLLVDCVAPTAGPKLTLEYGSSVRRAAHAGNLLATETADGVTLANGSTTVSFSRERSGLFTELCLDGRRLTAPDRPASIVLTDAEQRTYSTLGAPERLVIEENGPVKAVILAAGHHRSADGQSLFAYEIRFALHAAFPGVRVSYRWINDHLDSEFASLESIRFALPVDLSTAAQVAIGPETTAASRLGQERRLEQLSDGRFSTTGGPNGERAPGWIRIEGKDAAASLICRRFWELYPKAIGNKQQALYVDLAPSFPEGTYDECSELDLIKLHYYVQGGTYKLRQGVSKQHDLWILGRDIDAAEATRLINAPPVLAASPKHYDTTAAFGRFLPRDPGQSTRYDGVCERVYTRYLNGRESGKMYGALNFGDYWGERRVNWSNEEYDHQHSMAQMFMRSADARWYQLMIDAARHDIDVDHCHASRSPDRVGGKWTHSMGHTGGYIGKRYKGEWGSPGAGMTPTHSWAEGLCETYSLTGDPTALETAVGLADHYGGTWLNHYDFTNGRYPGWHLLFTMAVYRATADFYYLNAAKIVVERALERRTPGSGWERQMVPGHCHCEPRCRGACSFMQGILGAVLHEYWLVTGDDRIPPALVDSARYMVEQIWVEEKECFRYTSCPSSSINAARADTMGRLMLVAYEFSGDLRLLDIGRRSLRRGFDALGSLAHLRWTPFLALRLEDLAKDDVAFVGDTTTRFSVRSEEGRPFELTVRYRDGTVPPTGSATLTGPGLEQPATSDAAGRVVVSTAKKGIYEMSLTGDAPGPWLVESSLNRLAVATDRGIRVSAGATPRNLVWQTLAGDVALLLKPIEGTVKGVLKDGDGTILQQVTASSEAASVKCAATRGTMVQLELTGPGTVQLETKGLSRWAASSVGCWFNASAPAISVEGVTTLPPGATHIDLRAAARDAENDVTTIRWLLPGGRSIEDAHLREPLSFTEETVIRVEAEDARGNLGSASVTVRPPPVEFSGRSGLVVIQAEAFAQQGKGEALITSRTANSGSMITRWHASADHWLEWRFYVPETMRYRLYARYATDSKEAIRTLTIDGDTPAPPFESLRFARTGGFCTARNDWRLTQLGTPVELAAGDHVLRMANRGEGLALDYLVVCPE
ncbi:MAG: hypothetical protein HON70_35690, partial [Lentisphaerae bacterium]|nr:hypothetical protein [Lentisphaerota bacterium]